MKKLIIISCCGVFIACNSGDKNAGHTDTTVSTNQNAKAVQTDVDTNVTNIGTDRKTVTDTTKVKR